LEQENEAGTKFTVYLDSKLSMKNLLLSLGHELVHVKQAFKAELIDIDEVTSLWNGKEFDHRGCHYYDFPWEIEAHGRERGLLARWLDVDKNAEITKINRNTL